MTSAETHTVKRAIIMAAGKGERMRPLTLHTPKPLIRVNGVRMIDSVIKALRQNGIHEIYVVTGYLKEQFAELPEQYPGLQLIENPYYETCNNISSLYVAREHLSECFILDGDQIIFNHDILKPQFNYSGYSCIYTDKETSEWLMQVKDGIVQSCSRTGGSDGWQLYSVSRWTKEDGLRLKKHVETEFEINHNTQIYWDDVAMFLHPDEYTLGIYPMNHGDLIEIDSYEELLETDPEYVSAGGDLK